MVIWIGLLLTILGTALVLGILGSVVYIRLTDDGPHDTWIMFAYFGCGPTILGIVILICGITLLATSGISLDFSIALPKG